MSPVRYSILDPTGNITALVESPVEPERQPELAAELMRRHPEAEQVGFVRFPDSPEEGGAQADLRMAGGEFCGNAAICAAALFLMRKGESGAENEAATVRLRVSGAAQPVEVTLWESAPGTFRAGVRMPPALETGEREFAFEGKQGKLPLARMQGISHLLVERDSVFFSLRHERQAAERAVRKFCGDLGAECLGLLFLEKGEDCRLTPLVYVPGSGTVFWENSCASGSSAVGMILAARAGSAVDLTLSQPGGIMRVSSGSDGTRLYGQVRLLGEYEI